MAERLAWGAAPARLTGGLAIWLRAPSIRNPPYERPYRDLDLVAPGAGRIAVQTFLEAEGYLPDRRFNMLHGAHRLYYATPDGSWSVDVIFDRLAMSHVLDLRDRMTTPGATLSPADLLLSKLQVWEINRKDLADALCLVADNPLGNDDSTGISIGRLSSVLGADWGFCHTAMRNLEGIQRLAAEPDAVTLGDDVKTKITALQLTITRAPKTLAWKARARIGERMRWYETPEEVDH